MNKHDRSKPTTSARATIPSPDFKYSNTKTSRATRTHTYIAGRKNDLGWSTIINLKLFNFVYSAVNWRSTTT